MNGIYPDAVAEFGAFHGGDFRQRPYRSFAGAIRSVRHKSHDSSDRRDVDDRATLACPATRFHCLYRLFQADESPFDIDVLHGAEGFQCLCFNGIQPVDSRIVHQDIQAATMVECVVDNRLPVRFRCHILPCVADVTTFCPQPGYRVFAGLLVPSGNDHLGAGIEKQLGNTFSEPGVLAVLSKLSLLQVDVTANDDTDQALMKRLGIIGPPAILFFDKQGKEMKAWRLVGYFTPDEFTAHVQKVIAAQ